MLSAKHMRYAHSEGHLDVCYDDSGDYIITCGPDGDVRVYRGFDDDDPVSHRVGDVVYSVAFKNNKVYTATDDNTIKAFTFQDGQSDGIVTRFTSHATHFCFNSTGTTLVAGASDFDIKIVDVQTNQQRVFKGHEAPILSVAFHPRESHIASSSCDGTVRIWNVSDQKIVKVFNCLPKSTDFSLSKTLCRLAWDKKGRFLLIPVNKQIMAYDTVSWNVAFELTHNMINEMLSVICLSPCGDYVAGATNNGQLLVWRLADKKCLQSEKHNKSFGITGLVWHPKLPHIVYCDSHGYFGLFSDCVSTSDQKQNVNDKMNENLLETEDDDQLFLDAAMNVDDSESIQSVGAVPGIDTDVDDDDLDEGLPKPGSPLFDENASNAESASNVGDVPLAKPEVVSKGWTPCPLQTAFQPSSTPVNLTARFMVWNEVGAIIQYSNDDEQSINVEFHDTATHHAIHINNTLGHSMADLSSSAVLLASDADENNRSQLVCMHFGSWDNCKEWSTAMPAEEDILALCLGDDWVAVATDRQLVRIFSICGTQKQIFCLPGPVVTMAGHQNMLVVVYHNGLGIPGDQCLAFQLQSVRKNGSKIAIGRLPLSPKSTLVWLRFSEEGTPFSVDSKGIVRMFNQGFNATWVEVGNLREHCKGKLDNVWVVGVYENQQHIRAVICKGSKHPPVLPRPIIQLLPFQLPMCELTTDKGVLENSLWKTILFSQHDRTDESLKLQSEVAHQESLMKLFALACKSGREVRATELCRMMPSSRTVQLAIKYATRLHFTQLADRLGDIARQKVNEEERQLEQLHSDFESSDYKTAYWRRSVNNEANEQEEHESVEENVQKVETIDTPASVTPVLLLRKKDDKQQTPKSLSDSQTMKRNPFKITGAQAAVVNKTPVQNKGTSVFDSIDKLKVGRLSGSVLKPADGEISDGTKKVKSQMKLSDINKRQKKMDAESEVAYKNEMPTFDVWFESNKDTILAECGECQDEAELSVKAMQKYRQLCKQKSNEGQDVSRKRRRDDTENTDGQTLHRQTTDKLSNFVYQQ